MSESRLDQTLNKRKEKSMSEQWKKWHIELNEAIDKPSNFDITEMDDLHLKLYETWKSIQETKESLAELEELFNDYKAQLDMNDLPDWAWIWMKKHSRVSWKQEFIKRLGKTVANKISAEAKQKKHPQIGIKYIDPNPDKIPTDPETKQRQQKPKRFELKSPVFELPINK